MSGVPDIRYDAIVVGGGLQGLSTAYYLLHLGMKRVLVIERSYVGAGSSGRNLGGVRETHNNPEDIRLGMEATRTWRRLSRELGFNVFFRRDGYLYVASTEEELEELRERARFQRTYGVNVKDLSREEVLELAPYLNESIVVGGAIGLNDGIAYPFAAIWAFYFAFRRLGGVVLQRAHVKRIKVQKSRVVGVNVDGRTLRGEFVVLAAGTGSPGLAETAGVRIPAVILKRQGLALEPVPPMIKPLIVAPWGPIAQTVRGEVLAGYHDEFECAPYDFSATRGSLEKTAWYVGETIPLLRKARVLRQWAGHYVETPDKKPVIGETPVEGLYLDAAWRHYGFMMAPVVGRLLAKSILSGRVEALLKPYSLDRFKGSEG